MSPVRVLTEAASAVRTALEEVTTTLLDAANVSPLGPISMSVAALTADAASVNTRTGDIYADGSVRLQRGDQTWVGSRLHYNYLTKQMDGAQFRTGQAPFFAAGEGLHAIGEGTNAVYTGPGNPDCARQIFRGA